MARIVSRLISLMAVSNFTFASFASRTKTDILSLESPAKVKLDTAMSEINRETIRAMRLSYGQAGLSEGDIAADPIEQFKIWLGQASENIMVVEANAMVFLQSQMARQLGELFS